FLKQKLSKSGFNCPENSSFSVQLSQFGFRVFPDADLVERVESSVVSKSLKTIKLRCFNVGWMFHTESLVSQKAASSL
ncbi:TPA: hypothetical protein ACGFXT_003413, partial [Vibrio cholerae]